jgi:hypothetical protein
MAEQRDGETLRLHPTVGRLFRSMGGRYRCTSWDRQSGFWMEMVSDQDRLFPERQPGDRVNVSERAIGRTFHRLYEDTNGGFQHDDGCNCSICENTGELA